MIGVPTVDALAYNLYGTERLICPMMDARRAQVYTGIYTFSGGEFKVLRPQEVIAAADIIEVLNGMGQPVIFLGDGIPVYGNLIEERVKVPYSIAPAHLARQRAGAVGALPAFIIKRGKYSPQTSSFRFISDRRRRRGSGRSGLKVSVERGRMYGRNP